MKTKLIIFLIVVLVVAAIAFFIQKPKTSAPTTQSAGTDKVSDINADLNSATMTADVDALFKDIDSDINKL